MARPYPTLRYYHVSVTQKDCIITAIKVNFVTYWASIIIMTLYFHFHKRYHVHNIIIIKNFCKISTSYGYHHALDVCLIILLILTLLLNAWNNHIGYACYVVALTLPTAGIVRGISSLCQSGWASLVGIQTDNSCTKQLTQCHVFVQSRVISEQEYLPLTYNKHNYLTQQNFLT